MYLENLTSYSLFTSWEAIVGTIIFSVFAYLIGSLNAGHFYSKYKHSDLGKLGSKNYGATNAGRIFGKYGFIIVFAFDFAKGIIAGLFLTSLMAWTSISIFNQAAISLALIFVVVGHSWPIFFKFKGGKGVATSFGLFTVINWFFSFLGGLMFLVLFVSFRKKVYFGSLGSVLFVCLLLFIEPIYYQKLVFDWTRDWTILVFSVSIFSLVLYCHRNNIRKDLEARKMHKLK